MTDLGIFGRAILPGTRVNNPGQAAGSDQVGFAIPVAGQVASNGPLAGTGPLVSNITNVNPGDLLPSTVRAELQSKSKDDLPLGQRFPDVFARKKEIWDGELNVQFSAVGLK
jgi:hypothetical protein